MNTSNEHLPTEEEQMISAKKAYQAPVLISLGTIAELTEAATEMPSDGTSMVPGSAV